MRKTNKASLGVATVDRALAVLGAFADDRFSLSLAEIAVQTRFHKSTILRLMNNLVRHRYIAQPEDNKYRLGPMLADLGGVYQRSFRLEDHVLPVLQHLVDTTGESASFHIREGNRRLCLIRIDSPKWVRDHVPVGMFLPIAQGAAGKVLVSYANAIAATERLPIITRGALTADSAGMAGPVLGPKNGLIGALTLSGPKARFINKAQGAMGAQLMDSAVRLTTILGGDAAILKRNERRGRRPLASADCA